MSSNVCGDIVKAAGVVTCGFCFSRHCRVTTAIRPFPSASRPLRTHLTIQTTIISSHIAATISPPHPLPWTRPLPCTRRRGNPAAPWQRIACQPRCHWRPPVNSNAIGRVRLWGCGLWPITAASRTSNRCSAHTQALTLGGLSVD